MIETTQHKQKLLAYFDGLGFERWSAIYGDAEVSRIRQTIRAGHARMLALAEQWICEGVESWGAGDGRWEMGDGERSADPRPLTPNAHPLTPNSAPHVLDAGCGTGLLSVALARRGLRVDAVDLAPQMAQAAEQAARAAGVAERVVAHAADLEQVDGRYNAVACLDVLVHYPEPGFAQICRQLARLTAGPLVFTYAPREQMLAALHWLGGRFPTNHRRTEIQMIPPRFVERTLAEAGLRVRRTARVSQGFYHVTLVEAAPDTSR